MERENEEEKVVARGVEGWQAGNGYTVVSLNCMLPLPFTLFQMGAYYQKGGQIESQKIGRLYLKVLCWQALCVCVSAFRWRGVNVYMYVCVYFLRVCTSTKAGDGRPTELIFKALWKNLNNTHAHTQRTVVVKVRSYHVWMHSIWCDTHSRAHSLCSSPITLPPSHISPFSLTLHQCHSEKKEFPNL